MTGGVTDDIPEGSFRVIVQSHYGTLRPQVVKAANLVAALRAAANVPFPDWCYGDDETGVVALLLPEVPVSGDSAPDSPAGTRKDHRE